MFVVVIFYFLFLFLGLEDFVGNEMVPPPVTQDCLCLCEESCGHALRCFLTQFHPALLHCRLEDFVGDQVVAPVREACGQALGVVLRFLSPDRVQRVLSVLLVLQQRREWEARHGGLLGTKYLTAVRQVCREVMGVSHTVCACTALPVGRACIVVVSTECCRCCWCCKAWRAAGHQVPN